MRYRVWCLSWDDTEECGSDVISYRLLEGPPASTEKGAVYSWQAADAEGAVVAYAEYVHNNRDGWECTWPLKFRVRLPDGTTEDFEVGREYEPTFSARAVERKENGNGNT